jgi:Uma2 family endonuclease
VSVFSRSTPVEQVFSRPPIIAVEVLSPEDRHSRIAAKIRNYIDFGVRHIWVVDSRTREGWDCSDGSWVRSDRLTVTGTPIYLSLPELFEKVDRESA